MRIVYGIHGFARGHASRALAVLPKLQDHEILIFAGRDAYHLLQSAGHEVKKILSLEYVYNEKSSRISNMGSLKHNIPLIFDLFFKCREFQKTDHEIERFSPDLIVSDSEPWTQHVGNKLGVHVLSFDHFASYAYCTPLWNLPLKLKMEKALMSAVYKFYLGKPDTIIASAFFPLKATDPNVHPVGPIIRETVRTSEPSEGNHLLVYLSTGRHRFTSKLEQALKALNMDVRVYGMGNLGRDQNLSFCSIDPHNFVDDLATSIAVISSAGNQLVAETIYLQKPILAIPEESFDQRMNAMSIEEMQVGETVNLQDINTPVIVNFLQNADFYRDNCRTHARDSLDEVVRIINSLS